MTYHMWLKSGSRMLHNPLNVVVFILREAELQCFSTVKYVDQQVETKIYLQSYPTQRANSYCVSTLKLGNITTEGNFKNPPIETQHSNKMISSYRPTSSLFLETRPIIKSVV